MKTVEDKLIELAQLAEDLKTQETLALEEVAEVVVEKHEDEDEDEDDKSDGKSEIETDDDEDSDGDGKEDKPDFVDHDKDGDKEEDFKKAIKDKKAKDVKESEELKVDLGKLFEGQDLSEEFKTTAAELFEAAVSMRVEQELEVKVAALLATNEELQEGFKAAALEESVALKESLVDKVDGYLDFMVEQWMEKNELAINRGIKTEILESFVSGMKTVFESHYIDVPDEKYDLVEAAQAEVAELEARLDEEVAKTVELVSTLKEINRQIMIDEAVEGLVETDAEKFRALAEELSYVEEGFDKKLAVIKESYFSASAKPEVTTLVEVFMTDGPVETLEESTKISPDMARYLTAIERSTQ